MKKIILIAIALLLVFAVPAFAGGDNVKVSNAKMGKYITDGQGMTLYWYTKDSVGMSACSGACVDYWPLFYVEKVQPAAGLKADDFGTITRDDGKKQTTFRGYPLYYYAKDKDVGDMKGEGARDVWYVINPDKFPK